MDEPEKPFIFRRHWPLALIAILAAAFVMAVIAYKYTGDVTGLAKWGTSSTPSSD